MADATLVDTVIPVTVNLGQDVEWIDEFDWSPMPQQVRSTLDGAIVVETLGNISAGQTITVKCGWHNRSTIDDLIDIRDRSVQTQMTLTLCDSRAFTVVLAFHLGPPVKITPHLVVPEYTDAENRYADWYDVTLVFTNLA